MEKEAFELRGRVEAVLVAHTFGSVVSTQVKKIQVIRGHGIRGDTHAGTRLQDVREEALRKFGFSKGTEIANYREFSAVSLEELAEIATMLHIPERIPYGCLGENLVVSGIPKFTELPTGTMLFFQKSLAETRMAVLVVWAENMPCRWPGEAIQSKFPDVQDIDRFFPGAAFGKRGVVGSVYVSGNISEGDTIIACVPQQCIYDPT
ncbi:MAG: MOSC domain-containing protein [Candidatus Parcubacteria bacterium]|nr:MOSC domain-containing protein [Candidatus Parcubacteria bacterium]